MHFFAGYWTLAGLAAVMGLTLFVPFSVKKAEEELEAFLLVMGVFAVTISGAWSKELALEAARAPLAITAAVLLAGLGFRALRPRIRKAAEYLSARFGLKPVLFFAALFLGLGSSVITAIVAALVLAEIAAALRLERKSEINFIVYGCYAIGLGAALTPLGEPLSTIVVSKLKGPPHNADFFFLLRLLGWKLAPGILVCAALSARLAKAAPQAPQETGQESIGGVFFRAGKVYLFVAALTFLGEGLKPLAEICAAKLGAAALYWVNIVSAVLDNATLAAAEIVPSMSADKIAAVLLGLLVSGGMLIPGNIPNIISASKLGIKSREWAKAAIPPGLVLLAAYFVLFFL